MYRLLENHGKKILIFVGVGLMIVFILPPAALQGGSGPSVGEIPGGMGLTTQDLNNAEARLRRLNSLYIPVGEQGGVPALITLFPTVPQESQIQRIGEFSSDPLLLLLAMIEAEQRGIVPTQDMINGTITEDILKFAVGPDLVTYAEADDQTKLAFQGAVADLLTLQNLRALLAGGSLKISKPLREAQAVRSAVLLTTDYHLIDAEPFLETVGEPTDADLTAFFNKYADQNPGQVGKDNPFGVGYRLQNRAKVQYFTVARADVRDAIVASKTDFEWQKEAIKTYEEDRNRWAAAVDQANAEPETETETEPLGPALPEPSADEPTDLSGTTYGELPESVQEDIREAAIRPLVDERLVKIIDLLRNQMTADAQANRAAERGGDVATIDNLDSFEYLQQLADEAEERFDVRPAVTSLADRFRSGTELQRLDGIGGAFTGNIQNLRSFAQAAITNEVILEGTPSEGTGLPLLTPSDPLQELAGENYYLFRVTDAAKSEPATDLEPVRTQVVEDWKKTQAMLAAVARAGEIAESDFAGVEASTAEQVSVYAPVQLEGVSEEDAGTAGSAFTANLILLWSTGVDVGGIPLPDAMMAAAVKVNDVNTIYENDTGKAGLLRRADEQLRTGLLGGASVEGFDATWLSRESLMARTGYVDTRPDEDEETSANG
ncbi:MAG: hypothetical protein AAGD32_10590 [Planctomycetota bacterium]